MRLPEVEIVEIKLDVPEVESDDRIAEVDGDGFYYLVPGDYYYDDEAKGRVATLLVRDVLTMEADNDVLVKQYRAPATLAGAFDGGLRRIDWDPIYAVKPHVCDLAAATCERHRTILRVAEIR